MIAAVITHTSVLVGRVNGESGWPIWRAWLAHNVMCRRHGPNREAAIDAVIRAYIAPLAGEALAAIQGAVQQADPKGGP